MNKSMKSNRDKKEIAIKIFIDASLKFIGKTIMIIVGIFIAVMYIAYKIGKQLS